MPPKIYKKGKSRRYVKRKSQYRQQKLSVATVKKICRKQIRGQKELKHYDVPAISKFELYHNAWINSGSYTHTITGNAFMPLQGDGQDDRDGNTIFLDYINLKFNLWAKADRLNTQFRLVIIKTNTSTSLATYSNIFDNQTGNLMLDGLKKGNSVLQIVYDKIWKPKGIVPVANTDEYNMFGQINVPIKKKVYFYGDSSQVLVSPYSYHFIIMAYDAYGSLQSDNVGACQVYQRTFFREV